MVNNDNSNNDPKINSSTIDEIVKEFYALYGQAMHSYHILENGLLELYAIHRYVKDGLSELDYFQILANPPVLWTLGSGINKLSEINAFDDSFKESLTSINKNRIFLSHTFWWEKEIEFENSDQLWALYNELSSYYKSCIYHLPLIDEMFKKVKSDYNLKIEEKMGLTNFKDRLEFIKKLKNSIHKPILTLDELQKWLSDIRYIITDMNISINTALRILNRQDEDERRIQHKFFFVLPQQMRFLIVIHLAKLFSRKDNDRRNMNLLLKKLESYDYDDPLIELLIENKKKNEDFLFTDRQNVIEAAMELRNEIQNHTEFIDRIIYVRNKSYAHIDPDREFKMIDFRDLPELIQLSNKIFNKINSGFFSNEVAFTQTGEYDINTPIRMIAEYYRMMDEE